ncbi:hypothetical protein MLD38_008715 [Melastoma candidum]|uniref:Uncharacterized protein n=1 Tax=Melastoma candidum TaxID=119954 RepID=A0ACB9RUE1_9MYRT|nr:hypothetical protein MLD38_008715 [Melastoma candidum]
MGSSAKKSESGSAQKRGAATTSDSFCSTGSSESSSRSVSSSEVKMKVKVKVKESLVISPTILGWPIGRAEAQARKSVVSSLIKEVDDKDEVKKKNKEEEEEELGSKLSEMDMMKERFAKLLLGEDMSVPERGCARALRNLQRHHQLMCFRFWATVEVGTFT